ncbi:AraC family transcriptional regulator [Variovorax rhizosphaerae]|uniref:AraC family transcriptional regulator n=1 Tax=Variovorax rhizosphaerae TaxID=1836200 RepID=A0ABU8WKP2_9BURK
MALAHVHTRDLDEAIQAVGEVYCEHELALDRRARAIDTTLDVSAPIVRLRYGAPVHVDAGNFPDLFLVMRCLDGAGSVRQGGQRAIWQPGQTVPVSANVGTDFDFGATFSQATIKPDAQKLEALCSGWLGRPLDESLRFELRPFSEGLERIWGSTLALLETTGSVPLPPVAEASLQEFLLTLLLQCHPHNFSEELARPPQQGPMPSRLVRRAEAYMQEHAHRPLTIAEVARELGVSVRALQFAFQSARSSTPMASLRKVRLERARQALLQATPATTVTDVALQNGFFHLGRFSALYKSSFGESPKATLARVMRRAGAITSPAC